MSQPNTSFSPSPWQSQPNGQPVANQQNGKRGAEGNGEMPLKKPKLSPPPSQGASPYNSSPSTPSPMMQSPYATQTNFKYPTLPPNAYGTRPQGTASPTQQLNGTAPASAPLQASAQPTIQPLQVSPMGPPQRPADRQAPTPQQHPPTQTNGAAGGADPEKPQKETSNFDALNDVALSAGIDLMREDEYLRERRIQESTARSAERGNLSQGTQDSIEEELFKKHKAAARAMNERTQQHMEDPFLQGHSLRKRLERASTSKEFSADPRASIKLPMEGLFDLQKSPEEREMTGSKMTHAGDGSTIVSAALKAPSKVTKDAPMAALLSLLSLGCEDFVRGLVEDAYGEARNRRFNSDGVVPPDWSDLAVNPEIPPETTNAQPEPATESSWEQAKPDTPTNTNSFPRSKDPVMTALMKVARQDRKDEEARLKRRADRKARKAKAQAAVAEGGDTEMTAGAEIPKPMSKKELQKQAKADYSEEAATRSANLTAAMQLGGKSYSWLTGGKGKGSLGGRKSLNPVGASGGSSGTSTPGNKTGSPSTGVKDTKFGVWREDGVGGQGIQMRDWVAVLDRDRHCRKTLEGARLQLGRERVGDPRKEKTGGENTS